VAAVLRKLELAESAMVKLPNVEADVGDESPRYPAKGRDAVRAHTYSISSSAITVLFFLIVHTGLLNCAQNPVRSANP
jgi:hypothetical protein